ncbi:MAG: protein kinase domain-containing protein, partial [Pyrinomonadaceae bacterium]
MESKASWSRIEELFHAALEVDESRRAEFLREKCGADHTLLAEVLNLVAADERESGFLADSAVELGLAAIDNSARLPSVVGRTIGNYFIEEKLGEGGMGEVYLARDKTLERNVALKFLLTPNFDDPLLKQRLFREAQAAASLDHPNICRIYGLEEIEGLDFIVMQHVEGRTLSALIEDGVRLTMTEICEVAQQIVAGVAAAHACGLIHRDIKPSNIIKARDGQVVILDFGLAKRVQVTNENGSTSDVSSGMVFGTVCYMSPEQLRNEDLDLQTDIFSLGVLLYQLCTLHNPFGRESAAESISAVLNDAPDLSRLETSNTPVGFKRIITRCLEKETMNRYGSAIELLADIEGIQEHTSRFSALRARMGGLIITTTVIATLVVGTSSYWLGLTSTTHRLLILPLKNMTGDPTLDYMGQGISDGVSGRLGRLSALQDFKVLQYDSLGSSPLENTDDPHAIAKKVGADIVISGELKLDNEQVLASIEAYDVPKDSTLWATSCTGERSDPLALEEAVFSRVATTLRIADRGPVQT